MSKICLVACASSKLSKSAPAKDLYISALFSKSRDWAAQNCDRWYILSAKHGLLNPNQVIEPYNVTLNTMAARLRREWSDKVFQSILAVIHPDDTIIFLAGQKYREHLEQNLQAKGYTVQVPMLGMGIGKQLQWLTRQSENK